MGVLIQIIIKMEKLKARCTLVLKDVADLIAKLSDYKDEQWVLNFCDELNKLSVKYWYAILKETA